MNDDWRNKAFELHVRESASHKITITTSTPSGSVAKAINLPAASRIVVTGDRYAPAGAWQHVFPGRDITAVDFAAGGITITVTTPSGDVTKQINLPAGSKIIVSGDPYAAAGAWQHVFPVEQITAVLFEAGGI